MTAPQQRYVTCYGNLEENRHHIQVMLEPMAYRFPEADNLKTPYDDALLKNKV